MPPPLKAVVIGAGWAGKGHVSALRSAGVDVVAICARDSGSLEKTALSLDIPQASSDWRSAIRSAKPDIVTLATPPTLREEVVTEVAASGIHIACEKPLAMTAEGGARMLKAVTQSGVKHAYASTQSYDPTVTWISSLIRDGLIGTPTAIEISSHLSLFRQDSPWTWMADRSLGGGAVRNWLPHILGNVSRILGSNPTRAMGQCRVRNRKAPYLGTFHDVRDSYAQSKTETPATEWRDIDAEAGFRAVLEYPFGSDAIVDVAISVDLACNFPGEGAMMRIFGEEGTLEAEGVFTFDVRLVGPDGIIPQPMPERLVQTNKTSGDPEQDKWNVFFSDFVADIRDPSSFAAPPQYPTFDAGHRDLLVMDAILSERSWQRIPVD